ncbi:MAG: hypothetical protein LW636_04175 [Planctomycetaceae bacterium]|nr:hypothetical protein [Planctomycetaceae bacterium]
MVVPPEFVSWLAAVVPPGPVFAHRMQLATVDEPPVLMMQPASEVAEFATKVELRSVTALLTPIHSAPPPFEPVAVLPLKMQFVYFVCEPP